MAEQNPNVSQSQPTPMEPQPVEQEPKPVPIEIEPLPIKPTPEEEMPITLVDSEFQGPSKVHAVAKGMQVEKHDFQRPLNVTGTGATRVRIFHSRIAIAPMEMMEKAINSWIDAEEIEIKHVGQLVGTLEGKNPEPNIITMVWY